MEEPKQLPPELLKELIEANSIEEFTTEGLLASFKTDHLLNNSPASVDLSIDPRSGEPIIYNPSRAVRPHDYPAGGKKKIECPICAGNSTGIIDVAELQEGFTFINKNLYPVITPPETINETTDSDDKTPRGLHFVQWTSSLHDQDWHNLPAKDCQTILYRLAALEKKLFSVGQELSSNRPENEWYISIIKNVGAAVGGSLEHGHQQIVFCDVAPRRILNNLKFLEDQGQEFSAFLRTVNPPSLQIRDYGPAILLVSRFMRRPYEMILLLKDSRKRYLHEMDQGEVKAIALAWKEASIVIRKLMPMINKEVAYNVIAHNGPGAGLYFEFLPYTQEQGGLEQLGMSICQMDPDLAAHEIRAQID